MKTLYPSISSLALAGLLSLAAAQAALAQSADPASAPLAGGRMLPQAAVDACKGKAEGEAVSFTGRQGHAIEAHCRTVNGTLAAMPERGLRNRLISPEASAACNGKTAGASVSYQDREGTTRNGVCTDINGGLAALSPEMAQRVQERREKR